MPERRLELEVRIGCYLDVEYTTDGDLVPVRLGVPVELCTPSEGGEVDTIVAFSIAELAVESASLDLLAGCREQTRYRLVEVLETLVAEYDDRTGAFTEQLETSLRNGPAVE